MGVDNYDAGGGVPNGKFRAATAGAIRAGGGEVIYKPEPITGEPGAPINYKHVGVTLGDGNPFGDLQENPVAKGDRRNGPHLGEPRC